MLFQGQRPQLRQVALGIAGQDANHSGQVPKVCRLDITVAK